MSRVNFTVCPFCGDEHDRSSAVTRRGALPHVEPRMRPGDASMCIKCGEFSVMGWSDALRKPSPDESAMLARDPAVRRVREAWQETVGRKKVS